MLTNLRRASIALILTSFLFAMTACSDDVSLEIQVVTSLVPGAQFTSVETERLSPAPLYEGATVMQRMRSEARFGQDFVHGRGVASFGAIESGEQLVQVTLIRPDGRPLISRRLRATVTGQSLLRVHLTPDCVGVTCPAPAGSPALSECLGGHCVDERCAPPSSEFCPAVTFCNSAEDCPAPVSACAVRACVEGICQLASDGNTCTANEYCDPAQGCVAVMEQDAGLEDGGVTDTGAVDLGLSDAEIDAPDASRCGALCDVPGDVCSIGAIDCSGGSEVCRPYAARSVATPCAVGSVCNAAGECTPCRAGTACSVGCTVGAVDCSFGYERCDVSGTTTPVELGADCSESTACVVGDTCPTSGICLTDGTCGVCANNGAFCWDDQMCSYGFITCAAGGACVISVHQGATWGCGETRFTPGVGQTYSGTCSAEGICLPCDQGSPCLSENECVRGFTSCTGPDHGYGVGACTPDTVVPAGTTCAGGVCDGAGECMQPLHATHLGNNASYTGGCAITVAGGITCWDRPLTTRVIESRAITGILNPSVVSGSLFDGCALTVSGEVWCWGMDGVAIEKTLPLSATHLSAAGVHGTACAVVTGGQLYCWGNGYEIGTGDGIDSVTPQAIAGLNNVSQIDVGTTSSAVLTTGEIVSWGLGTDGVLGDGSSLAGALPVDSYALSPVTVVGIDDAVAVSRRDSTHACALRSSGEVWCWGLRVGLGSMPYGYSASTTPVQIALAYSDISAVHARPESLCTLRSSGEYWCLGNWNALARGSVGDYGEPGAIQGVANIVEVSAECGRVEDDTVFCWYPGDFPLPSGMASTASPSLVPAALP